MARKKFTLEFIFKASPAILYRFLTTPDCLVRWFCEVADIEGDIYTFTWEGSEEEWEMLDDIEEERVRFVNDDLEEGEFLDFNMYKSDVTNETIMEITSFCDESEVAEESIYWETQIKQLRSSCGG